jgi:hypothetical protein
MMRASVSVGPPAANGTTIVTGFVGYALCPEPVDMVCATALAHAASARTRPQESRAHFMATDAMTPSACDGAAVVLMKVRIDF